MRFILAILVFFSFQTTWERITPENESFSLKLPDDLKFIKKTEESQTAIGKLSLTIYQSDNKDEYDNIYIASHLNYGDNLMLDRELKDSLLLVSLEDLPGEMMYYSKDENINYHYFTVRKKLIDQSLSIKARLFFIEDQLFINMVYSHEDKMLNSNIDTYLNSFRLETSD